MPRTIATTTTVDRTDLLEFARPRHRMILVTTRRDGAPQLSPDAEDGLVEYFRCISGEHSDWDEYRAAMRAQGKSLIRVSPTRWGPIATGGFPARLA